MSLLPQARCPRRWMAPALSPSGGPVCSGPLSSSHEALLRAEAYLARVAHTPRSRTPARATAAVSAVGMRGRGAPLRAQARVLARRWGSGVRPVRSPSRRVSARWSVRVRSCPRQRVPSGVQRVLGGGPGQHGQSYLFDCACEARVWTSICPAISPSSSYGCHRSYVVSVDTCSMFSGWLQE